MANSKYPISLGIVVFIFFSIPPMLFIQSFISSMPKNSLNLASSASLFPGFSPRFWNSVSFPIASKVELRVGFNIKVHFLYHVCLNLSVCFLCSSTASSILSPKSSILLKVAQACSPPNLFEVPDECVPRLLHLFYPNHEK